MDPLRSDGELTAKKRRPDGVSVQPENHKGVAHEFWTKANELTRHHPTSGALRFRPRGSLLKMGVRVKNA